MSFRIRQAHPPDIEGMVELLVELFSIEKDFKINPFQQRTGLELLLRDTTYRSAWVAEGDDHVICGMCTVQLVVSTAQGTPSGWVEDVIVRAGYRGRGIGKALLVQAENWARQRGATRLQLLADINNPEAFLFYEKLKWVKTPMQCVKKII